MLFSAPSFAALAVVATLLSSAAALFPTIADAQSRGDRNDSYRPPEGRGSTFPGGDGPLAPPQGGDVYYPPRGAPNGVPSGAGGPGYEPPYAQAPPPAPGQGYEPPPRFDGGPPRAYVPPYQAPQGYPPPAYGAPPPYVAQRGPEPGYVDPRYVDQRPGGGGYGAPYSAPPPPYTSGPPYAAERPYDGPRRGAPDGSYSSGEIADAGRGFFGSLSQGMASAVEYTFKRQGRPNGYILGEEAGGAFFGGLRYGEGTLYTRDAGTFKVYWQGPSLGFDIGGEGNRVMVLVYNLRNPDEIFDRFGGVNGSAYVVGGVGVTFQQKDHITLAPIRAGVGLRLGAAVGYLKYSRKPTWNPF